MRRLETPQYQFALQDEAHLRGLFERALREHRTAGQESDALKVLRDDVCSFVRRAKAEERQVETVIVALKDIFGVPDRIRAVIDDEDTPPNILLARRLVRWCIQEYYEPADVR